VASTTVQGAGKSAVMRALYPCFPNLAYAFAAAPSVQF
jgi:hypothetical protein